MRLNYRIYGILLLLSLLIISGVNAIAPVANFTSNVTTGTVYPLVVQFDDNSTTGGIPTTWNWSFGDGRFFNTTNPLLKNVTYQYAVAGKYNVSLLVNNTDGSNITIKTNYINLTSDNDDNLTAWLHMNGTNGSTTFSGEKGNAWATVGNAYISTNIFKYGGASGAFPGVNGYISTPASIAFAMNTSDFTLEMWVYVNSITHPNNMHIISKTNNARAQGWGLDCSGGNDSGWDFWMGNETTGETPRFTIPNKTWTHIAVIRESGIVKVYINGNLTVTKSGLSGNYDTSDPIWIGRQSNTYFDGYVDEFRFTNGLSRWKSNFTTPYNEYSGTLETLYPDINPGSTFRYKTDPTGNAYIDNITPRNRTLQIQNITNTSYVFGEIVFDPLHGYVKSVQLNNSYFPSGLTLLSSNINNTLGTITFNISRAAGFNTSGTNRASILDYTIVYYNFSDGHDVTTQFFGFGFLINGTTNKSYPIHNFLGTPVTYGDWNFTANFVADNLSFIIGNTTTFTSSFTGSYPNRWNWSFGDGTFNDGINSTISHVYTTGGLKTVTLTEYMWQSDAFTVNSSITRTNYINVQDILPVADFTSISNGTTVPVQVDFTDISTNSPTAWEWNFGDGNISILQNPTHIYEVCGNFTVGLKAWNTAGWSNWNNKTNYVTVNGCVIPTPGAASKIATKVSDTQNLIFIGVIIIIIAGLVVFTYSLLNRR